jgi:hypothetical protein
MSKVKWVHSSKKLMARFVCKEFRSGVISEAVFYVGSNLATSLTFSFTTEAIAGFLGVGHINLQHT